MRLPVPPKNPTAPIPHPDGMVQPHMLALSVGRMGQGKTWLSASYIKAMKDFGSFNKVYLLSPSYATNKTLWDWLEVDPSDAFTEISQAPRALNEVVKRIQAYHAAYKLNMKHHEAYEKHRRGEVLTIAEQQMLEHHGPPLTKMDVIRPICVIDDLQASPLFNTPAFRSLILRMRHLGSDPQIGCSFWIICQSLRSGLPRQLRSCVSLWFLFPTRDQTVIKDISSECAGHVGAKEFAAMFEYATHDQGDHPFLTIDLTQRDPAKVFRRKLEEYLDPDDFSE